MVTFRPSSWLFLTLALSLVPTASPAGPIALGIKGGLSAATLHGSLPTDALFQNGVRYGAAGGVSITVPFGGIFSLQPEVLFVQKGTSLGSVELTDQGGNVIGTADVFEAVDYVEFPLLARIGFRVPGPISPYVLAGPTVGLRVTQELRLRGDATSNAEIDLFRRSDLGLALGSGAEVGRARVRGLLEVRYTLGVTGAARDSYSDRARNGDLLLLAGVALHP